MKVGDFMDAGSISKASMSGADLTSPVGIAVTKLGMDSTKQNAQAMLNVMDASKRSMERAVNPSVGGAIDVKL